MKKAAILGHFAFGEDKANGQTIKTKIVSGALRREIGEEQVDCYDTMGGWAFLLKMPFVMLRMLRSHHNVIVMPAYKGVHLIAPLIVLLNIPFRRKLHYVVIGGWLPEYVCRYPFLRMAVKRFDVVYVETQYMIDAMELEGYTNTKLMPNFKPIRILDAEDCVHAETPPYPLCTFSRVMKEKGIEDAILAVRKCNEMLGRTTFRLDIYGLIQKGQEEWFEQLMSQQPDEIHYCGIVPFNQSSEVLGRYFALLFPTHFWTEGFPGTLIDAMAAGTPPIASDCPSNKELITDGVTGMLYEFGDTGQLTARLIQCAKHPELINDMRPACLKKAGEYLPENIIKVLASEFV
mgnify:CR=1 FL=1